MVRGYPGDHQVPRRLPVAASPVYSLQEGGWCEEGAPCRGQQVPRGGAGGLLRRGCFSELSLWRDAGLDSREKHPVWKLLSIPGGLGRKPACWRSSGIRSALQHLRPSTCPPHLEPRPCGRNVSVRPAGSCSSSAPSSRTSHTMSLSLSLPICAVGRIRPAWGC